MTQPFAHSSVDADRLVAERGSVYHGGILRASSGGAATVDVYDGLDTGGDLIDSFYAATSQRDRRTIAPGVKIRVGLYVDLGSNVSAFTAYYSPVPREEG